MRSVLAGVFSITILLLSGCAIRSGSDTAASRSPNSELRVVAVEVINISGYTADVFVGGTPVGTLLPNGSTVVDVRPTTQKPRAYGVVSPSVDVGVAPTTRSPRAAGLRVRFIYERQLVESS
jgi:hypothetical protein